MREAQANVKKTSDDVARYKLLVDKNEIPRQQYDTAVAEAAARRLPLTPATPSVREARAEYRGGAERGGPGPKQRITQADASIRIRQYRAAAGCRQRIARQIRAGAGRTTEGAARSGQAESQLLHDCRARHGHRRQEDRGTGAEYFARPADDGGGSARRHLGHGEFQGNAVEPHGTRASASASAWMPTTRNTPARW